MASNLPETIQQPMMNPSVMLSADSGSTTILCNAPFNVAHTLTLYERHRGQGVVRIVAVGVPALYEFFKSCNLPEAQIDFVPAPLTTLRVFKRPQTLWLLRREIDQIFKRHFAGLEGGTIYTFGDCNDLFQASLHARLAAHNRVYYMAVFFVNQPESLTHLTFSQRLAWRGSEWVSRSHLLPVRFGQSKDLAFVYLLDADRYGIIKEDLTPEPDIEQRYAYHPPAPPMGQRTVLLLESRDSVVYLDYELRLRQVMELLVSSGYHIYVKGHPRCGFSPFLNDYPVQVLPSHVPAEFLGANDYDYVLGIHSLALTAMCRKRRGLRTVSLLKMFTPDDLGQHDYLYRAQQLDPNYPVCCFPGSPEELRTILLT